MKVLSIIALTFYLPSSTISLGISKRLSFLLLTSGLRKLTKETL